MPQLVARQPPPDDYYADNVSRLLGDVRRRHDELLSASEARLVAAWEQVSRPAQRLFARLLTRKGPSVRVDSLTYPEVPSVAAALAELCGTGLVRHRPPIPADRLLPLLRRSELQQLFPHVRGRTKAQWIEACLGRYSDAAIRQRIGSHCAWAGVADPEAFAACRALFFGGDSEDLSTFVIQDLGIRRYEVYPLSRETRPFPDRRALERFQLCRRLEPWSQRLDELPQAAAALRRALQPPAASRPEQRCRDRILNRVGRWHERRGEWQSAIGCYRQSTSHPARERQVRLLQHLGDLSAAQRLLESMREDPWCVEEEVFAARFRLRGARRGRCRSGGGVQPRISWCQLRHAPPRAVERHALELLTANGGVGWHLENALPLALAGLAYWDVVYAPVPGAFSHAWQLGPADLFWPDFARARRLHLERRRAELAAPGALREALAATARAKRGVGNRLVRWGALPPERLELLLHSVPEAALWRLTDYTIRHLHRARTGFPDLLVIYGSNAWELVEVKGPTDTLQPAQRVWLQILDELALPARVLRFRAPC